jgi:hypothetical protein
VECQAGKKVIAYINRLFLRDVIFKVSEKGRQRVIRTKHKNVHAYIEGYITDVSESYIGGPDETLDYAVAYYNPYTTESFVDYSTGLSIANCDFCDLDIDSKDKVIAIWKQRIPRERKYDKSESKPS